MNNPLFQQNIISLSSINPELAFSISQCSPSENCIIEQSKDGSSVPVIKNHKNILQLHSLYNPVKEGEKLYKSGDIKSGFVIVFGLGGGYHLYPYLDDPSIHNILIIETDKNVLRKIIENIDLGRIFASRKTDFLIDPGFDELKKNLIEKYNPSIYGDLSIIQLKNRINSEPYFFENIFREIKTILDSISNDFASQAQFGKRWFKNTLQNLQYAEEYSKPLSPSSRILIAGAGPSIEKHAELIRKNRGNSVLISTDTALPFLKGENIIPDIIISIDCQHITYNHFIGTDCSSIPLVLDLSSPVHLSRIFKEKIYFSSGHPFSRYIATYWKNFPVIDTSGGNVGHSAVSLAKSLGAKLIELYGLDYSYPDAKPYAKNSLIYSYFRKYESRTASIESSVFSFVYSNPGNIKSNKNVITNSKLDSYYKHLRDYIKANQISTESKTGSPRNLTYKSSNVNNGSLFFSSGRSEITWRDFVIEYRNKLIELPVVDTGFNNYYQSLSKKEKELWATVFPVCASIRKENKDEKLDTSYVLNEGKKWCIETINKVLKENIFKNK